MVHGLRLDAEVNRRTFLRALAAAPVVLALAPLATTLRTTIPFRLDPRVKPGMVYLFDEAGWERSFYPGWLNDDGTVRRIEHDDSDWYVATFRWDKPLT